MKRDWDLIRQILFKVESVPAGETIDTIQVEEFNNSTIVEHIRILLSKGLLVGKMYDTNSGTTDLVKGMSWDGYDFLENARNDTIWKKVMAESKAKGTSTTMVVINGLLTKAAQKYAGLDK